MKKTFITVGGIVIPYIKPEKPRSWAEFKRHLPGPMDCTIEEIKKHQKELAKITKASAISCQQHILPKLADMGVLRFLIHRDGKRPEPQPLESKAFATRTHKDDLRYSIIEFCGGFFEANDENSERGRLLRFAYQAAIKATAKGRIVKIEPVVWEPGVSAVQEWQASDLQKSRDLLFSKAELEAAYWSAVFAMQAAADAPWHRRMKGARTKKLQGRNTEKEVLEQVAILLDKEPVKISDNKIAEKIGKYCHDFGPDNTRKILARVRKESPEKLPSLIR